MDKSRGNHVDFCQLPDYLLCEILMNLPTKDVVKTSLLCRRWRNVWQSMFGLDLEFTGSLKQGAKFNFINRLKDHLKCLQRVKLRYDLRYWYESRIIEMSINTVITQHKIQHLDVGSNMNWYKRVEIPPTIYTSCERLVSLKLCRAVLPKPLKSVSLPCLKIIDLQQIEFDDDSLVMEMLISGCPVLETLTMDAIYRVKVSSLSLLSFSLTRNEDGGSQSRQVILQTPRLKYLKLDGHFIERLILNDHLGSIVKLILSDFIDLGESFLSFLIEISGVRDMTINCLFLFSFIYTQNQVTHRLSKPESSLPKFYSLSVLTVKFMISAAWDMLIIFLESCPNLKSLVLEVNNYDGRENDFSNVPRCVLSSLEFVEMQASCMTDIMKLASYFLENSTILKKLTLCLTSANDFVILEKFLTLPRRSETCQVVIRHI